MIGIGPSLGRWATSPTAVMLLQRPSSSSAQTGTSWRTSTSGRSALASSTISWRCTEEPGGEVLPWKRFQLRIRIVSLTTVRAPCASSSPTQPRSRHSTTTSSRRPRPAGRRGRARHLAVPLRRGSDAGGIRPPRGLLSRVVPALPALSTASAAEGGRAPGRAGTAGAHPPGRSPRPVAGRAGARRRAASAPRGPAVFTAHDLLPRRTAHREDLWRRLLGRFDRIVVHSERGRETLAALGRRPRPPAGDPARRVPQRSRPDGRRPHSALARGDPPVQGAPRRDRGGHPGGRRAAARRRRSARAPRRVSRRRR